MRTTTTGKATIADAEVNNLDVAPTMPHLIYNPKELDELFPPLQAPQDVVKDQEESWSSWDAIASRGDEIIEGIKRQMFQCGRRRVEGSP